MDRLGRALAFAVAVAGCSTPSVAEDAGAVDAASGPQPVGAPCDPALATPCLPTGDPCLDVRCDPTSLVCASSVLADAAASCTGGQSPCSSDADCDVGLACGFPIGGGCSSAVGTCLNPPLLCESDAAACGGAGTTCGCNGAPVAVLVSGYAAAPTPAGGACPSDGGSTDASDAASL